MANSRFRIPALSGQHVLDNVQLHLLAPADTLLRERFRELMEQHHYLKSDPLVGEQLRYVAEVERVLGVGFFISPFRSQKWNHFPA